MTDRRKLLLAARKIAANRKEAPAPPPIALRKIFVQERRDWTKPDAPRIGWKRGELFEVLEAIVTGGDVQAEWGDVGYYVAQTWDWLWRLYTIVTPQSVILCAIDKFERRAR